MSDFFVNGEGGYQILGNENPQVPRKKDIKESDQGTQIIKQIALSSLSLVNQFGGG